LFKTDQIDALNHGFKALVGAMTIRAAIPLYGLISVVDIVAVQQILDTQKGRRRADRIVFTLALGGRLRISAMTVGAISLQQCGNTQKLAAEIPKVYRDLLR
jgi:hypothetical protein